MFRLGGFFGGQVAIQRDLIRQPVLLDGGTVGGCLGGPLGVLADCVFQIVGHDSDVIALPYTYTPRPAEYE